ncbi:DNA repair protein RecO [Oscillospiraceae bacterium HV4-5-C5C]|nr:DNA repair protein RecO [Oscillospiraceae bacterium HV4-5-C5C]
MAQSANQISTRAVILKTTDFGDTDRYLTLLSPDLGLIEVLAKGVRSLKGKRRQPSDFLTLADFELFYYRGRYRLNQSRLVYAFLPLRLDLVRLACAAHLAELIGDLTTDTEQAAAVYELFLRFCYALEKNQQSPLLYVHAAEIRLMQLAGFGPDWQHCIYCQHLLAPSEGARFSFPQMGLLCASHAGGKASLLQRKLPQAGRERLQPGSYDGQSLTAADLRALRYFSEAPLPALFNFQADTAVKTDLDQFLPAYLSWNLDKQYHHLDMLDKLDLSSFNDSQ